MENEADQNQPELNAQDEPLRQRIPRYAISLPERMMRAGIALVGGLVQHVAAHRARLVSAKLLRLGL